MGTAMGRPGCRGWAFDSKPQKITGRGPGLNQSGVRAHRARPDLASRCTQSQKPRRTAAKKTAEAALVGVGRKKLKMGAPDEVLAISGYAVGGVSPVGWLEPCDSVADESLRRFEDIWAAAGAANAVFPARTEALVEAIGAQWARITKEPA